MSGFGWRWTRGRGARQAPLFVCALLAVVIAFLGRAEASIFDSARATLSDWTGPALSKVREPLLAIERWIDNVGTLFTVYRENMQLRQENAELRKWQHVALSLESRMKRYETLLNAVPDEKLSLITARVIGESSRPFIRTMILNAGSTSQVEKGQAVMDGSGLLGRIYVTGQDTSWVILLTDLNSRVPVVIEPSHRRAILTGDNTASPELDLAVGDGPVEEGDRVLSTGDGGLLPPDLPIGVVVREGGALKVALFARPGASDIVHVVDYRVPEPPAVTGPAQTPPPDAPISSRASVTAMSPSQAAAITVDSDEELDR